MLREPQASLIGPEKNIKVKKHSWRDFISISSAIVTSIQPTQQHLLDRRLITQKVLRTCLMITLRLYTLEKKLTRIPPRKLTNQFWQNWPFVMRKYPTCWNPLIQPKRQALSDGIPATLLKETADVITPSLCRLFNKSISSGSLPDEWKTANIVPVYKKGDNENAENYRPISLLCIISKVLERCILNNIKYRLLEIINIYQHGFLPGRSCATNLIDVLHLCEIVLVFLLRLLAYIRFL